MSYTPKYYDSLDSARSIIRSNLRADIRNALDDSYLEEAIEIAELYRTDSFLETTGFDPDNLDTKEKAHARDMSTAHVLIYVTGVLPLTAEEKRDHLTQARERLKEAEGYFIKRKFPVSSVQSKHKRIQPGYGREWEEDS